MTRAAFDEKYKNADDRFEFWFGEAKERSAPTAVHGRLKATVMQLLNETDLYVASSVELRIIAEANPLPDVIADRKPLEEPYPTTAVEVAVEIVSPKDSYAYLKEKCKAYQQWGFRSIYVVDPSDRSVEIWKENRLQPVDDLMDSIPVARIWSDLDRSIRRK